MCTCLWCHGMHANGPVLKKMSKSPWSIFPPGKSSYLVYTYKCNEDEEPISITKLISRHLFCQTIQIVTQNAQLAQTIRNFVTETTELGFLLIKNMPVYALIDDRFLKSYLQNGKLYGLSGLFLFKMFC